MHRPTPNMPRPTIYDSGRGLMPDDSFAWNAVSAGTAQRIAADLQAISQSVTNTRADLDVLRNGAADLAEDFDNRIEGLRDRFITEVERACDENRRNHELVQERRIDNHGSLHDRFEVLKSSK